MRILGDVALRQELERQLPALEACCQPAGAAGVVECLAPMLAVFGLDEKTATDAFWEAYVAVLGDLPTPALRAGVRAYMRGPDAEWFPKPGPLRKLCLWEGFTALGRARAVMRRMKAGER